MRPIPVAAALPVLLTAGAAQAQSTGDLEARVRALEARVAALEGAGPAAAAAASAIRCKRLNVNGSGFTPATVLTVTVNGATAGTFNANTYEDLEDAMRPGANRVALSFAAPGPTGPFGTQAELRCLPPDSASSRDTILSLQPVAGRLSAETTVEFVPG